MSLTVYHSNHLDILKSIVGHIMMNDPLESPFEKEYLLIQNFGMAKWLQTEIASELGILTQCEFLLPSKMLSNLCDELLENSEHFRQNLSQDKLFWPLVSIIFNIDQNDPDFDAISSYIRCDDPTLRLKKSVSLAKEISAVFDKYIVYRPDWIAAWDRGETVDELPPLHAIWQQKLWREVMRFLNYPTHFGNIKPLLEARLDDPIYMEPLKTKLPKRLFIIGLTSLPPLFLDLLMCFKEYIDIHLFFNNPSQFYWGDVTKYYTELSLGRENFFDESVNDDILSPFTPEEPDEHWQEFAGHPLLASLGKVGRDHLKILQQYPEQREIEAFSEPEPSSLLHHLQYTIFNLLPPHETDKWTFDLSDRSLEIHTAYSPLREIEALYDQLLHLFNQDPTLKPSEIVVMTPDIEKYAPLIEAVFGEGMANRHNAIPYSISDISLRHSEPLLDGFLTLLTLPTLTFKTSEILPLLKLPEVMEKYGFTERDFDLISYWIEEAFIRFGIDHHHLETLGFGDDPRHTWLWGLKRMLLGYATHDETLIHGHLPYLDIKGMDALLLGKLTAFIDHLIKWREALEAPRPLIEWQTIIAPLWNDFFADPDPQQSGSSDQKLTFILNAWNDIIEAGIKSGIEETFEIETLRRLLEERLIDEKPIQNFIQGKVTFCSFVPMRAIPFKVVAMIGLNQEDFPKSTLYHDFDLIQFKPYPGDRTRHSDDRYLFLEAMMSASEKLYLSYIGHSIQDNSERLPSLLIDDLFNYLKAVTILPEGKTLDELLITHHPMAPYNPELYQEGARNQSFQDRWIQHAERSFLTPTEFPPYDFEHLTLGELIHFYQDPTAHFAQKRLELRSLRERSILPSDDENFTAPTGLTRYLYRREVLDRLLAAPFDDIELKEYAYGELKHYYHHKGYLPKYAFEDFAWNELIAPLLELALTIKKSTNPIITEKEMRYQLTPPSPMISMREAREKLHPDTLPKPSEITLLLPLPELNQKREILWDVGEMSLKRSIRAYFYHLAQSLFEPDCMTTIYTLSRNQVKSHSLMPLELPHETLEHFIEGYYLGMSSPIPSLSPTAKDLERIKNIYLLLDENQLTDFKAINPLTKDDITDLFSQHPTLFEAFRLLKNLFSYEGLERRLYSDDDPRALLRYILFYQHYMIPIEEAINEDK
ncbi:exodeoxyribonuclease V subunit gamma [Ignatzschineria sp. RMDPL8A]|uniref:exodeoxyribonuclease V subunit gamma n=1 Tax=Ignatzschineria sp. RMDPL8A TaxID=2999236 RepID=UPI00244677A7|nr:exodeoxyribonuclease V subunit gamma [Ignatzschineria sp. RMDPL8A]MDG9730133.1 exodeoxyribonuclease V subunit gamma [Ignatzschineria sp. RMDPL8A]